MKVVDLTDEYMNFVTYCTHIDEKNKEISKAVKVRENWIIKNLKKGLKIKVVVDNNEPVGFAHCLPIELGTWGMSGKDLMTIPCLTLKYKKVYKQERGSGIGRTLIKAVENEAKKQKKKGVAVLAYDNEFWFMPSSFFNKLGYKETIRDGDTVIMLKTFEPVNPPIMHKLKFKPNLVPEKVIVDAFWNPICLTSIVEIQRVRDVCLEYGDKINLNEYNTGKKEILEKYQISRALFFNGKYKCWGYEAPKEGIREEIEKCLNINEHLY